MFGNRSSTGTRTAALLALAALAVVLMGSTGGFAADPDATDEWCVGCEACKTGECGGDGGNPLSPHHHCCTTCCMSHASLALPAALSTPIPATVASMTVTARKTVVGRTPQAPYRPPRS